MTRDSDQGQGTKDPTTAPRRLLFINQFAPPDPAPTARLAGDVAVELRRRGHEVDFVGDRSDYRGKKTLLGSRALRELFSLARVQCSLLRARRADVVVFLTSPPLLPLVSIAGRLRHRRARWIHWAMDLYPDVAVALGEIREGSPLHRATAAAMRTVYGRCDRIIVLDEAMAERIATPSVPKRIVAPWPAEPGDAIASPTARDSSVFTWLYSGNLGRAHEWFTLLEAQALLESRDHAIDLVFQGSGHEMEAAQATAAALGLRRCHWRGYAPEGDLIGSLLAADALVVTQRPETAGCLWPSKLGLLRLLGKPVVWVGPDGSIASDLREQGHFACEPGEASALAAAIRTMAERPAKPESSAPEWLDRIREVRETSIAAVADAIETTPA